MAAAIAFVLAVMALLADVDASLESPLLIALPQICATALIPAKDAEWLQSQLDLELFNGETGGTNLS